MRRLLMALAISFVLLATVRLAAFAKNGDITHVISHDKTLVITDPSKGYNLYPKWAVFPPKTTQIRKAVLYVTYACPDGLQCGEWDYIDAIHLRRVDGDSGKDYNIELARMISPYGRAFDSVWHFTWHVDITDFSFLLHDSVEIEFKHTGYESNTDRGWLITLDFAMTEGRPAVTCLGMDTLWCGSFPYGDTAKPIESLLHPIRFHNDSAAFVRVRIVQTGHGMDDSANCAEFCNKWREVRFDDSVVNKRQIWRECGDNPLYPQAGTWIFDRANWCPGSIVHPDVYDFAVKPNSDHTVDIDMEPYINPNKPSANWYVYAYLFYYTAPWAENDVSLEEIIVPNTADEYARMNPTVDTWRFRIRNNGRDTLRSAKLTLGVYQNIIEHWSGLLPPFHSAEVRFGGCGMALGDMTQFMVSVSEPNGKADEYPEDSSQWSEFRVADTLPSRFTLAIRTNHDSTHNWWNLTINDDHSLLSSDSEQIKPNVEQRYNIDLSRSIQGGGIVKIGDRAIRVNSDRFRYQFVLTDTAGDGLNFWYNVEGGYGYVRLIDTAGHLIRNFNSDFGNEIRYAFTVTDQPVNWPKQPPVCEIFPPRNQGKFEVDLFFDDPTNFGVEIVSDSTKSPVFSQQFSQIKDSIMPFDITGNTDGVYWFKLTSPTDTLTRRIRLKHDN